MIRYLAGALSCAALLALLATMPAAAQRFTHDPMFSRSEIRAFELAGEEFEVAPGDSLYADCQEILFGIFGSNAAGNTDEIACLAPGVYFDIAYYHEQAYHYGFNRPLPDDPALRNRFCRAEDLLVITTLATGGHFPANPDAVDEYVLTGITLFQFRQGGGCPGG